MGQRSSRQPGFTLIELLVVVAILALLVSMLLPSLSRSKLIARIVMTHSDLRTITMSLRLYREESRQYLPPTRFSCSSRTAYELPVELQNYLPSGKRDEIDIVAMRDPFSPGDLYRFRAVGPAIVNESTIMENESSLWVPAGFPNENPDLPGKYYKDPKLSPVLYAVWSTGPVVDSPKYDIPGRLPIPRKFWLMSAGDTGVITHMETPDGRMFRSP